MIPPPPTSTLFPYTTLFRSLHARSPPASSLARRGPSALRQLTWTSHARRVRPQATSTNCPSVPPRARVSPIRRTPIRCEVIAAETSASRERDRSDRVLARTDARGRAVDPLLDEGDGPEGDREPAEVIKDEVITDGMEERGDPEPDETDANPLREREQLAPGGLPGGSPLDGHRAPDARHKQQQEQDEPRHSEFERVLEKHVVDGIPTGPGLLVKRQHVHPHAGPDDRVLQHKVHAGDEVAPPLLRRSGAVGIDLRNRGQAVEIAGREEEHPQKQDRKHRERPAPRTFAPRPRVHHDRRCQRQEPAPG